MVEFKYSTFPNSPTDSEIQPHMINTKEIPHEDLNSLLWLSLPLSIIHTQAVMSAGRPDVDLDFFLEPIRICVKTCFPCDSSTNFRINY